MDSVTDRTVNSRKKQAQETKQRIKRVADQLISEREYEDITIAEIARFANISVGGFYHYFSSKEELFFSGYADFDGKLKEYIDGREYGNCLEAIRDLVWFQCSRANEAGPGFRARDIRVQLSTHSDYLLSSKRYLHTYLKGLVQQAIDKGEFRKNCDAEEISDAILRMTRGDLFDWALRLSTEPAEKRPLHDLEYILQYYSIDKE